MRRRSFLSLIGAAGLAPALPSVGAAAPVAAGYNRYMYGLAVFHARTRASLSAGDLMARLKVTAVQADAMIGEMTAKGVLGPVTHGTTSVLRTIEPQYRGSSDRASRVLRRVADWTRNQENERDFDAISAETETDVATSTQERTDG